MKKKVFTFIKLKTGGKLEVEAKSEKEAREQMKLDPDLWRLESKPGEPVSPSNLGPDGEPAPD